VELARRSGLPVVRRAEMLAELMRLKPPSRWPARMARRRPPRIVATLLDAGHFDPTVINGGIINAYGTNARLGAANGWWSRRTRATAASCA
jgi:UDP-N-acetylmuramate--alanine ligase